MSWPRDLCWQGRPAGGLRIVEAENDAEVDRLVKDDPLWSNGLRKSVRICAWSQVFADGRVLIAPQLVPPQFVPRHAAHVPKYLANAAGIGHALDERKNEMAEAPRSHVSGTFRHLCLGPLKTRSPFRCNRRTERRIGKAKCREALEASGFNDLGSGLCASRWGAPNAFRVACLPRAFAGNEQTPLASPRRRDAQFPRRPPRQPR